jgi:hypothetical protein
MSLVRAILVLVTLLSFATPVGSWSIARELSPLTTSSMTLAAPTSGTLIARAAVKAEKTFGSGFAIAADVQPLFAPSYSTDGHSIGSIDVPNLDRSGPPLAPRPPPHVS